MTAWAGAAMARGVLLSDWHVPASRAPLWRSRELDLARCRPVVHAHSWAQCGKRGRTALTESATWSTRRPSDGRRVVQGDREPLWLRRGRRLLDTHSAAGGSTALARRVAKRIVNRAYVGPLPPVLERDDPAYGFPATRRRTAKASMPSSKGATLLDRRVSASFGSQPHLHCRPAVELRSGGPAIPRVSRVARAQRFLA